ncbi:MAG: DUF4147 domain-containing protein [Acidobacteriota bacterium]
MPRKTTAAVLRELFDAALRAADPAPAVSRALADPSIRRALEGARKIGVFAVGKAAARMLAAAGLPAGPALAILPRGYPAPARAGIEVLRASHPEPDRSSVAAARRAVAFFRSFSAEDAILCLVSGGTSSLLCLPADGWTLAAKRAAIRELVRSGASIVEVNRLRRRLSGVKGGRLARRTEARIVSLVVSDVPGDRASLVGSGPTIRRRREDRTRVVASNADGIAAASAAARRLGLAPVVWRLRLTGEASECGRRFARFARRLTPGGVLIAGGETTVEMPRRSGRGGRNLELSLGAALELGRRDDPVSILAAASDGIDGSSGAAGASADETTLARAGRLGLDPERALSRHDTAPLLAALGDLLVTGPTRTNVGDWAFALRRG